MEHKGPRGSSNILSEAGIDQGADQLQLPWGLLRFIKKPAKMKWYFRGGGWVAMSSALKRRSEMGRSWQAEKPRDNSGLPKMPKNQGRFQQRVGF